MHQYKNYEKQTERSKYLKSKRNNGTKKLDEIEAR